MAPHATQFVLVRGFFSAEETGLLRRAAKEDKALDDHAFSRADGEGGRVRLSLWNHPGDSMYGMFPRCERMVGGAWAWHQDRACLSPWNRRRGRTGVCR